jgi:hypothetical protein
LDIVSESGQAPTQKSEWVYLGDNLLLKARGILKVIAHTSPDLLGQGGAICSVTDAASNK